MVPLTTEQHLLFNYSTIIVKLKYCGRGGGSDKSVKGRQNIYRQALWYYHIVVMIGGRKSPSLFALLDINAMVGGRKSPSFFPSLDIRD